ncbi:hypothetical protein H072_2465 [Dactylellina haptotyla CBS 200.50]|uniref:N-acetyltransferase domain-containing protein n=1 Tax=Dactylellina haptotyla (strain CBS 200.50) TaxID=1284197 RepID=S8BVN8_DACHA|nr:hypothetical protein H072_2465 [Dactylellina haptotyla CBS 200.50]
MATPTTTHPEPIYRVATLDDIDGIGECGADAMMEDDLFGALYPRRKSNPAQFSGYFRKRARQRIVDHNIVTLVAELPVVGEDGLERKMIAGFAQWQRFGGYSVETKWDPLKAAGSKIISFQDWAYSFIEPKDETSDPQAIAEFMEDFEELENRYWRKDGKEHDRWHLQLLAVHSSARRRGIGGRLVELGVEKARRDGCDASLEASPMGLPLYKSKGFEVIGNYTMKVKGPDGNGIPTPVLLWKNPNTVDSSKA